MTMWRVKIIDRVHDNVHKLRQAIQKRKKVLWCDDETEKALKVLCKLKQFLDRSQRAQENKGKGETKHSQGSKSTVSVALKMEKELNRKPKNIEVFEKTHSKKGGQDDELVWSDERSKETTA